MRNDIFEDSQIRAQKEMVGFLYCAELSGPAEIQTDPAYERLWQYLLIVDRGEVESVSYTHLTLPTTPYV